MTALTDELEERIDGLEAEVDELQEEVSTATYELEQSETHNYDLSGAVSDTISDLQVLDNVPLNELASSIEALIERLRDVL